MYARFLVRHGRVKDAIKILNDGLDLHPAEPFLNYQLAMTLQELDDAPDSTIRRAFEYALAEPVGGYLPELEYGIYLFQSGDQSSGSLHFRKLRGTVVPYWAKTRVHKWICEGPERKTFDALIMRLGMTAADLKIDGFDELVFAATEDLPTGIRIGQVVQVNVCFNLLGPRAMGIGAVIKDQGTDTSESDPASDL